MTAKIFDDLRFLVVIIAVAGEVPVLAGRGCRRVIVLVLVAVVVVVGVVVVVDVIAVVVVVVVGGGGGGCLPLLVTVVTCCLCLFFFSLRFSKIYLTSRHRGSPEPGVNNEHRYPCI